MELSYLSKGKGKDLVFFHGYGANKECFLRQIDYFSRSYKVTAFDFPGFGKSDALPFPFSVGDYAAVTEKFLSRQGIVKPFVVAHSFGARVAVKMAAQKDVFDRLVLTGPAGIIDNRNAAYRLKIFKYRLLRRFSVRYAEAHCGSKEYRCLSPLMKESYKKIVNEDLRLAAKRIRCPVLILEGEKDSATPLRQAKIYAETIPKAKLVVMKNCTHFAFLDDPLAFQLSVEEFLS